jgi:hypothetical protein
MKTMTPRPPDQPFQKLPRRRGRRPPPACRFGRSRTPASTGFSRSAGTPPLVTAAAGYSIYNGDGAGTDYVTFTVNGINANVTLPHPYKIHAQPRLHWNQNCPAVWAAFRHIRGARWPLARQLGVYQPGGHYGCLRDRLEPVRYQPRSDPLALRGRLGSGFSRSLDATYCGPEIEPTLVSKNLRRSV